MNFEIPFIRSRAYILYENVWEGGCMQAGCWDSKEGITNFWAVAVMSVYVIIMLWWEWAGKELEGRGSGSKRVTTKILSQDLLFKLTNFVFPSHFRDNKTINTDPATISRHRNRNQQGNKKVGGTEGLPESRVGGTEGLPESRVGGLGHLEG